MEQHPYLLPVTAGALVSVALVTFIKNRRKGKHEQGPDLQGGDRSSGGLGREQHRDGQSDDRRRLRRAEARARGAQKGMLKLSKMLEQEKEKWRNGLQGNANVGGGQSGHGDGGQHDPSPGNDSGLNEQGAGGNE